MLEIIKTADGSNTIYNSIIGEHYHSRHGALQESRHVFLNAGLQYFLSIPQPDFKSSPDAKSSNCVSILEAGFGTGLNFLLSADFCIKQKVKLDYTSIEPCPLSSAMIEGTGYQEYIDSELWEMFQSGYNNLFVQPIKFNPYCRLQIAHCPLLDFQLDKQYDIIYFDAFAVTRQPEMWTAEAISHTIKFLKPGGVFVTYAITGNLKRMLKQLEIKVEKLPGAAGKREMLRAVKGL